MKNLFLLLTLFCATVAPVGAQVELSLQLGTDGVTYTAFARSQVNLLPPIDNIVHAAQVAVVVPAGSFELVDLQNHTGQWQLASQVQHPVERPNVDYVLFMLVAPSGDFVFEAGQPLPLFSFKNKNGCTGRLEMMNPTTDPFLPPNSLGVNVKSTFIIEGAGAGNAITGTYEAGAADCFRFFDCTVHGDLELLADNFYQISLTTDATFFSATALEMVQVVVKVPTNFFHLHGLTNLLPGQFSFGNISRFDGPAEDQDHDYIQFRLNATGPGLSLQPSGKIPLMKFANGGSCQGDSIFLLKNDDPFLPPNSQTANLGQSVKFFGSNAHQPICASAQTAAAACVACLFTDGILHLDSVQTANPVACLGGANGMLRIFAHGAQNPQFSVDGGQNWSSSNYFTGLTVGNYQPKVRATKFGCPVSDSGMPVSLTPGTDIELLIEVPTTACSGSDVAFKILSPSPLPANASFNWSGPLGFDQTYAEPVIFGVNEYQSGQYALLLVAPGCNPATASAALQVNPSPAIPDILSNGPVCFGDKLKVFTNAGGARFEWLSPLGANTLPLPELTTDTSQTLIEPSHPAYRAGNWQVQVTDSNGCTATSQPLPIQIKPRPPAFAETSGPTCPGGQAQLLSNPLPGATYQWKKLGESTVFSMQPNPLISNVLASQAFQLEVTHDGCVSVVPATATVSLSPQPAVDPTQQYTPTPNCSPQALYLFANATGTGLSYAWSGPNGFNSQVENPVVAAAPDAANGSYALEVTNVYGCKVSHNVLVTGVPNPVPMPLIQGAGAACPGDDVVLQVQPYAGSQVSYQWFKGTSQMMGQTSNELIFNAIQPNNEGNYKLRAVVDGCTVESASYLVDVQDRPIPNPDFFLSTPCEGGNLQFFSNINGITDWHWTGPGGFTSDSPTPVIYNTVFDDIGAYQLTVTGSNGCTANASLLIDGILPVPAAPLVASNSPVCPGTNLLLTVLNPMTLGTVDYEWQNANGDPVGSGEATLTLPANDPLALPPFFVRTVVNTCPSPLSEPVPVTFLPAPVAMAWNGGAVCAGEMAQLFAATQPNASYEWQVTGQPQVISIEQNPVLSLTDSTDFQLVVRTIGCDAAAVSSTHLAVNPNPTIVDMTQSLIACEGAPVTLSAANSMLLTAPVQYVWTGPGGFSFTGQTDPTGPFELNFASISPTNEGSFTLSLTSAEGCQSAPQSVAVEVSSIPTTPTLTVADAVLCESELLQLDATPTGGNNVTYEWFFHDGTAEQLLGTTSFPTYFLPNMLSANAGSYFVKTTANGCITLPSNLVPVTVISLTSNVQATNPTSSIQPACAGADVQLSATLIPGATYHWYGPAGFFATVPNPLLATAGALQAGTYLAIIGQPECAVTLAVETTVYVVDSPETPALAGPTQACEGTDVQLWIANAEGGAVYDYFNGQSGVPFQSGGSSVTLMSVGAAQNGNYVATASMSGCASAPSVPLNLLIVPAQTGLAFAGEDQTICEATEIPHLQATLPTIGNGHWTPLDGGTVVQPTAPNSAVVGVLPGENRFVWTLTNGICPGAGSDTVMVFLENLTAVNDIYTLAVNDTLWNIDLLENDFPENTSDYDFFILKKPVKGQLFEDGTGRITYIPYPNAFGEDGFSYRFCSMSCPDVCDQATVNISLDGSVTASDCFLPNLITPDADGLDDVFVIPCAAGWPGSELLIFNRWGSTVFKSPDYQNDWGGTYEGKPLPPGTYFYQLRLNDGKGTVLKGYVVVA